MATSRRNPKAAIYKTYKASGGNYSSLATWEAATDINLTVLTTLSAQANSGQAIINLTDATPFDDGLGWEAGDTITLDPGGANEETHTVSSRSTNQITLTTNLANTQANGEQVAAGIVLLCSKGSYTDTVTVTGATTSGDFFRVIRAASNEGHGGIPKTDGTCVYFNHSGTSPTAIIYSVENNFTLQDLVFKKTDNSTSYLYAVMLEAANNKVIGCMTIDCSNAGTGYTTDFYSRWSNTATYYINCLSLRSENYSFHLGGATTYVYNCSAINGNNIGFYREVDTVVIKNCWSSCTGADYSGTFTATTCGSADATSPTTTLRNMTLTYVNSGADDFHYASGSDGINDGTDLSADANFAFDDDINNGVMGGAKAGEIRSGTWDLGFDEYVAVTPMIFMQNTIISKKLEVIGY